MRCRAATLAATVEGPGFPFSMADERKKQKQEEIEDRKMRDAIPLPSPYKGAGSGLGRPARPIQPPEVQGIETDLLPQPATARFPASTACHPRRMKDTWRACRTEGTSEATSPHSVIVGCGRLEDRDPAPFSK